MLRYCKLKSARLTEIPNLLVLLFCLQIIKEPSLALATQAPFLALRRGRVAEG
jgi:hypothetical protein